MILINNDWFLFLYLIRLLLSSRHTNIYIRIVHISNNYMKPVVQIFFVHGPTEFYIKYSELSLIKKFDSLNKS